MSQPRGLPTDQQRVTHELEAELDRKAKQLGLAIDRDERHAAARVVVAPSGADAEIAALAREEPAPRAVRRKMPKSKTSTWHAPYASTRTDRETIKTSFNLQKQARLELDAFFSMLGPGERNVWAERVLVMGMRRTLVAWERSGRLARHPLAGLFRELLSLPAPEEPDEP